MPRGTLKPALLLAGTLSATGADYSPQGLTCAKQHAPELAHEAVTRVVQAFVGAWCAGDTERMSTCLHPDLVKHLVGVEETAPYASMATLRDAAGIPALLGGIHASTASLDLNVLDVEGKVASVRVLLGPWLAYMHLAGNGRDYRIVNVLWEWVGKRD